MDTLARMTVTSAALCEKKHVYTGSLGGDYGKSSINLHTPPGGLLSTSSAFEGVGEAEWRGKLLERGVYLF